MHCSQVRGEPDERLDHNEDVDGFLPREAPHLRTALQGEGYDSVRREPVECFPNRPAAYPIVGGEVGLDEALMRWRIV